MNANAKKTIGQQIAEARKAKGWTLEEAARRTNLKPSLLASIEADEFDRLPSVSNARGFIRLYARELELDGWALLKQFNGTADVPVDMLELEPEDLESIPTRSHEPVATSQGIGLALIIGVILVALGVGAYKLYTVKSFIKQPEHHAAVQEVPPPAPEKPAPAKPAKPVTDNIPTAKAMDNNNPPKATAVTSSQPTSPEKSAQQTEPLKATPVEQTPTAQTQSAPPPATKGLRLQLIADANADEKSRWVRIIAIRNGKEESIYADALPPGKVFPIDDPWVADGYIIIMSEASVIGIIQNGGSPQKYELPGVQRVRLPVN
ncbi:MAG: helix-turn-helix domain-containing protein [Verrucomicrobiales bacterium]|jgi:cytoskeleton protein RodZ|nr:helix-turn-helix domain-containing protein [Verrucomicrobiales bacterium]